VHIPDGFINAGVSAAAGVVSAGGIGYSLLRAKETLSEKLAPMAGLVAAFIFAVQMLNFPVAAGTSGHLLGGCLAAIMVGPWAGAIVIAVVLLVQALLFADGGLTAYGLNVFLFSLIGSWGGYAIFRGIRSVLPATRGSAVGATGVAAFVTVVLTSIAFVVLYSLGGNGDAPIGTVFAAMVGVHSLIAVGEAVISAFVVGVVLGVRPDMVYGAQDLAPSLQMHEPAAVAGGAS
jgi:cobalt/nickel transport system permease protein